MEKFGIFELLDTLSALTAKDAGPTAPAGGDAFRAPDYGIPSQTPPPRKEQTALADFLARHDEIAKKAGRDK